MSLDDDLAAMSRDQLEAEVRRPRTGIRGHRGFDPEHRP